MSRLVRKVVPMNSLHELSIIQHLLNLFSTFQVYLIVNMTFIFSIYRNNLVFDFLVNIFFGSSSV